MKNDPALPIYDLVILGANGGIGRQAVEIALKQGHRVTAILRSPANLTITHPNLIVVKGDIMKPETFEKYLENKDAVISAIGKNSLKETILYSEGNKNLLNAMKKMGTTRVFFISASGLDVNPSHNFFIRLVTKYILQRVLKNMYADLERMEKTVKESDLNWTIMRPPQLTNRPFTGHYRFAINGFLKNGLRISRADLANFMISNITNAAIYKTTIEVAY
ncbi:MAG TPA: SDR family oxidoreductase [Chitinophagaceae bacterium]|nr:SDR family oxidoreductase [Chitinophagaceae bacterium]